MPSRACGILTAVIGAAGLCRWVLGFPPEFMASVDGYAMTPHSAIALMVVGMTVVALSMPRVRHSRVVAGVGAGVAVLGVWRLLELASRSDLWLESTFLRVPQLHFGDRLTGSMTFPAALSEMLAGGAVAILAARVRSSDWRQVAKVMGTAVMSIGMVFLLGHLYGRPVGLPGSPVVMAPATAVGFSVCGVGLLAVTIGRDRRERAVMLSSLRSARGRLEARVAERTVELTRALEALRAETEQRRKLEEQYRHAQKIESIGRLAGGIAHDFNNVLTAIVGHAELAELRGGDEASVREHLGQVRVAAKRATDITKRLLAFARRQRIQETTVEVGTIIDGLASLLRPLVGERVVLRVDHDPGLWCVRGDASQLEQVFMNLCVNARDAMRDGGELTITASNVSAGRMIEAFPEPVPAGDYVVVEVRDSGEGITPEVRARLFEPFFTTKAQDVGTGLGLATSHGIVRQHGGHITVESSVGQGSVFRVYLRRDTGVHAGAAVVETRVVRPARAGVVLVIDDDRLVLETTTALLAHDGWKVLSASGGDEAVEIAAAHRNEIGVVLSDTIMPGLSKAELLVRLREICPRARIAFMSGYSDDEFVELVSRRADVGMLRKPFTADQLRDAIGGGAVGAG